MTNFSGSHRESSRAIKKSGWVEGFSCRAVWGAGLICPAVSVGRDFLCSEGVQAAQSGEVAVGDGQGEAVADAFNAADGLGPAEGLFDLLPAFLELGVASMVPASTAELLGAPVPRRHQPAQRKQRGIADHQ